MFKGFPYLYCVTPARINQFNGEFKKYRMTQEQIINLVTNSGGILAVKISNFVGIFDYFK